MNKITGGLTVLFDDPFWIGIFEHIENGKLTVCKITFGAEPKNYEIYDFIIKKYYQLKFSPAVDVVQKEKKINPKRMQRMIKHQIYQAGIGTKSQQAIKLQHGQMKIERKITSRETKEIEKQHKFMLKKQKRKNKHRGH